DGERASRRDGDGIAARLGRAIAERGLTRRQVVLRMGAQWRGTAYAVLAGTKPDPRIGTIAAFCNAIEADPDRLLGRPPAPLDPELQGVLDEVRCLPEDDQWRVVECIRDVRRPQVGSHVRRGRRPRSTGRE
ncbi:MAG: hypothetical protein M3O34_08740, partial [Chloroflexota bacterium]|nr:hypothetical protein [Chloroflexota bacterium]